MNRLTIVKRKAAEATGLHPRTFARHDADLEDLRMVIQMFREEKFLRVKEFAETFGVTDKRVYGWIYHGHINAFKIFGNLFIPLNQKVEVLIP